jgi:hypothetical protein
LYNDKITIKIKENKMNIAKALKQKNIIVQKINELQHEVQYENSKRVDAIRKIDIKQSHDELLQNIEKLINIKLSIFKASVPVREKIFRLSELKSQISFLRGINTTEGKQIEGREMEVDYVVIFDKLWAKEKTNEYEKEIEKIQDELDEFNYKTKIT